MGPSKLAQKQKGRWTLLRAGSNGGERPECMAVAGAQLLAASITQFGCRCPNLSQRIRQGTPGIAQLAKVPRLAGGPHSGIGGH